MGHFASKQMLVYYGGVIKLLPVVLIIVLISGGLLYWRFFAIKSNDTSLIAPQTANTQVPVEVPKTLPNATIEDRVKVLEEALVEIVKKINGLGSQSQTDDSINSRLNSIEASITDLKLQVSSLGQAAPVAGSSKSTTYIPLGAGGSWDYSSFTTLSDYQISLDPANFPGYTGIVLEVIFRVVDSTSTASVRFYNSSDGAAVSSEVSTSSSSFNLASSSSFKLASGSKTYALQAKNSNGKTFFIQLARLRVNY